MFGNIFCIARFTSLFIYLFIYALKRPVNNVYEVQHNFFKELEEITFENIVLHLFFHLDFQGKESKVRFLILAGRRGIHN